MEFDDLRAAQWIEIDGNPLIFDLELIRITIGKDGYLLTVVEVNSYGHGPALQQSIDVVGVASHIANIEDTIERKYVRAQLLRLRRVLQSIKRELDELSPYIHESCSVAALLIRETAFRLAMVGISMNGHCPSRETGMSWSMEFQGDSFSLQPVFRWQTLGSEMHSVERVESDGYGGTWTKRRPGESAVIPVGYAYGYSVSHGNCGRALFRGRPVSVVGRVCMNILMADVTDIPDVSFTEDAVQLEELAPLSDTINSELFPRPSPATMSAIV